MPHPSSPASPASPACPICGATQWRDVLTCTDHFVTGEEFHVEACEACGFKQTKGVPGADVIGNYYHSEAYISHSNTNKGVMNRVYHLVRTYMLGRKRRIIASLTPGNRLLDIGSGTGHFLQHMHTHGYQVAGVEVDADTRQRSINRFGLTVSDPSCLYQAPKKAAFDVVTLWHVLEHVEDLDTYLDWIHQSLTDTGYLIVAVPNCASLDATLYGRYWAAYDVPRHRWHFTPADMKALMARHGFNLITCKALPFDAFYNSLMSAGYAGKRPAFLQGGWTGLRSWLNSLGHPERCSSVIYIINKQIPG
ncbi:MAG: class I SAM-dependent methyltransferase [Bacteroidales bacterium]|nr:class I SAM-dependent methyltransferase [Bacteroidales bacterium]